MYTKLLLVIPFLLALSVVLNGQDEPVFSEKRIVKTALIPCVLDTAWWKWTTHEGLNTFFSADNQVGLWPGGAYEIYFSMDAPEGLRGSEGCEVLAVLPKKIFSFTWNAPPSFPDIRNSGAHTWVVLEFEQVSDTQTLLLLTHLGWREGEDWDGVYNYFDKAWGTVLDWLVESCMH